SALLGREQQDVGIVNYFGAAQRCDGDKRIILSVNYQSRYADLINDSYRAGTVVVVVGICEAVGGGSEALVKLPDRVHLWQTADIVKLWIQFLFRANSFF